MKNHLPAYECILTANDDETSLRLDSVTNAFCRVVGINPHSPGLPLEEIVPEQTATWIYQAFSSIKDGNETIRDLREIQDRFWSYTLSYDKPQLTITLLPIWDVDETIHTYSMDHLVNLPLNKFCECFYDSILVSCADDIFRIASISPDFSQIMGINIGDNIDVLLTRMRTVCSDKLIKRSIALNKICYFMDIYIRNKRPYHLLITLVPLNHYVKHMLIGIHLLKSNDYYQMMKSVNPNPKPICDAGNIGIAVFETEKCKYKKLLNANPCFNRLVYSHEDFEFLRTKVIPICCAKQSIITIAHRLGNLDCLIAAIPTLNYNQLFLFVMPETGPQSSIQSLADRLTKREFEIACHIVNGNSIKGISVDCGITEGTVKKNLANIYSKLQISNRVELVRLIFSNSD